MFVLIRWSQCSGVILKWLVRNWKRGVALIIKLLICLFTWEKGKAWISVEWLQWAGSTRAGGLALTDQFWIGWEFLIILGYWVFILHASLNVIFSPSPYSGHKSNLKENQALIRAEKEIMLDFYMVSSCFYRTVIYMLHLKILHLTQLKLSYFCILPTFF